MPSKLIFPMFMPNCWNPLWQVAKPASSRVSSLVRYLFCRPSWTDWVRWAALAWGPQDECTTPHRKKRRGSDRGWPGRSGLARLQASSSGRRDSEQTDVRCPWLHHVPWLWAGYFTFWVLFSSIKLELYYLLVSVVRIKQCNLCKSLGKAVRFPTDLELWSEFSQGSNQPFWESPSGRQIKLISELATCVLAGKPCWAVALAICWMACWITDRWD